MTTDDQQLIAQAREWYDYAVQEPFPWMSWDVTAAVNMVTKLTDALSAAAVRNVELQAIFDGGFGDFEEDIKDREARRYREQLAAAAVRYRAEGWDEGRHAGVLQRNPYRTLLDENNETQNHQEDGR